MPEHPLDKELCHSFCSNFLHAGYKEGCLGTVIVSDGEDGVVLLGLREFGDEVEGNDFQTDLPLALGILVPTEPLWAGC